MKRILLYLKGICMGAADVIPGVSGGTMALILGIYKQLIDAIEGLHLRWLGPLWRWATDGRRDQDWEAFREEFDTLNVPFLLTLGLGILTALAGGSAVIPPLMESYPVAMRAFFFGLILASVWVPFQMIDVEGSSRMLAGTLIVGVLMAAFGYVATAPGRTLEATYSWKETTSRGETLETIARRGPSAMTTAKLYWAPENASLRSAIERHAPDRAEQLAEMHRKQQSEGGTVSKKALEKQSRPYRSLEVPEGTSVRVPRPAPWFVFFAGSIAICAMILPGISGSFILLILGSYFFVLNAVKGTIETAIRGHLPLEQSGFVGLFMVGCLIGILSFARLMKYLLETHPAPTLGGLVGLMIGCLRGIWPFRASQGGGQVNVWPEAWSATVSSALTTCLLGIAIVAVLTYAGNALEETNDRA